MTLPTIKQDEMIAFLTGLLNTPSPTGFTQLAIDYTEAAFRKLPGVELQRTRKGALVATLPGLHNESPHALTAHVDTLGAMVKEIKSNGRLKMTQIGGYAWNAVEGEGVTVFSSNGERVRGCILIDKASVHVHGKQIDLKREDGVMEVRLDAHTASADETKALGIKVGDFIGLDARVEVTNGFVRSRHLDDKAGVACLVTAARTMAEAGLKPEQTTYLHISNYEEVGHGASAGIPDTVTELISVDMAAVGEGQTSDEFHSTLCVKDTGGPYHHDLSQHLRSLADEHQIPYVVDIYPFYGSDGEAFWHSGGNAAVALIGPGVDASHNYERTHTEALVATTNWVLAYLLKKTK